MKKILVRLGITVSIPILTLIVFIFNPSFAYSKNIEAGNVTIYYNTELDSKAVSTVKESLNIIRHSELFDSQFKMDLCLDDHSIYPTVINKVKGPAFGFGLANKVVLACRADFESNKAVGYGESWNLTELLAHEMMHTLQYNSYGWSTLTTTTWKLEGYAEYISRSKGLLGNLDVSIQLMLNEQEKAGGSHWFWITLEDGTGVPSQYLADKVLVQYLMEIERLSYDQILNDERTRESVEELVLNWYNQKNS